MKKIGMIRSMLELMGVVFLRFRPVPRLWSVWLVGVNGAGLLFYQHLEAQVALAVVAVAVIAQALIYQRQRFTRILGIAHVMWVPMFAWMATRLPEIAATPGLANWLVLLAATVVALKFRSKWGALIVCVLWSFFVSGLTLFDMTGGLRTAAMAEGCIGSPTVFIVIVAATCVALILHTAPRPEKE